MAEAMYIGELARLSGATPKAIRLYESLGLIPEPKRRGKYRIYSPRDISLVHMIRRAQAVGFQLAELKEALAARAQSGQFPVALVVDLIERKREQLRSERQRLDALDTRLADLHEEVSRTFA